MDAFEEMSQVIQSPPISSAIAASVLVSTRDHNFRTLFSEPSRHNLTHIIRASRADNGYDLFCYAHHSITFRQMFIYCYRCVFFKVQTIVFVLYWGNWKAKATTKSGFA
jgi:hypothetical protein